MAESDNSSPLSTPPDSPGQSQTADHEESVARRIPRTDHQEPPLAQRIPTMGIDDLMAVLTSGQAQPGSPEFQLIEQRQKHFQVLATLRNAKRALEEPSPDGPVAKRPKMEFKYTNIEKLTSTASLRQYADWKADMIQLFNGSPEKFSTDTVRLVAAQQYMDDKAKTLWRTHLHTAPEDENWLSFLQWAQQMVSQGANAELIIYRQHHGARQQENQSPVSFDAYLSSLESVMEERSTTINAIDFFTRLTDKLQARMEMSGRESFPTTRQGMVAFAQRIWHGMERSGEVKTRRQDRQDYNRQDGQNHGRQDGQSNSQGSRQDRNHPSPGRSQQRRLRPGETATDADQRRKKVNQYPTGKNEKGEACCYICGSTDHFARQCDRSSSKKPETGDTTTKGQPARIRVAPVRQPDPVPEESGSSDSDSDSEN